MGYTQKHTNEIWPAVHAYLSKYFTFNNTLGHTMNAQRFSTHFFLHCIVTFSFTLYLKAFRLVCGDLVSARMRFIIYLTYAAMK